MSDAFQISDLSELADRAWLPFPDAATCRRAVLEFQLQREKISGLEIQAEAQAARIAELEAENASLAANQCLHGIQGGDGGSPYCPRIAELENAGRDLMGYVSRADWFHYVKPETRAALEGKGNE